MIHVIPNNDLKPHECSSKCACKPSVIKVEDEIIVLHNSYDGREYKEELIKNVCKN